MAHFSVPELLEQLNGSDECAHIEAKSASQLGHSLLETVCAFANEPNLAGGYLLLGVTRQEEMKVNGELYAVSGIEELDKRQADIASQCASAFNQPIRPIIWTEEVAGKHIIGVYVTEAQPHAKPIYFKNQLLPRGAFRRIGSTDQRCTEDDLLAFYADQQHGTYDETIVTDSDLSDLDPTAILDYRRARAEANADAEELNWTDEELFRSLSCVKKHGSAYVPTVAGILLFGTPQALRRYFPMMRVDYIRVPGRAWVSDPDRRFDTIELRGPLIRLIGRIRTTILGDLPKAFSLPSGRLQRLEIPRIPDRVIREVTVNAVMHRSYKIHGAIQIIRYDNRLEIRNPGHSLIAEEHLGEPGSKTRNPKIAAVLHETNFAETKGSGVRVMRQLMADANLSLPTFESNRSRDEFVVTLLTHHFLDHEDMIWLARFQRYSLSDAEARALIFVRETGAIGNAAYRDINRVDTMNARRHLQRLRDLNLLEQKGKGFETYYVGSPILLDAAIREDHSLKKGQLPLLGIQTPGMSAESSELDQQSLELAREPSEPGQQSSEINSQDIAVDTLLQSVAPEIALLGARPQTHRVRTIIRRLCTLRPLRAIEIASLLGRTQGYVQQQYLRPMLRDGVLEYTIPDRPVHPKQAYRATGRINEEQ